MCWTPLVWAAVLGVNSQVWGVKFKRMRGTDGGGRICSRVHEGKANSVY